ncbi:unnamed protein product [Eruca vesicaria subsp. sativa]|uniref:Bifunctional inhibitor/plant lipid transfer protein/seed storage helical domain-containing protein n=1 Tax=Eruca vesicaria subsp. sativa TaxID=29727 RepID=A0ABC8KD13_ERUVS|nr:unnamed protein product [Eruca vesicaria subsp. sativa]
MKIISVALIPFLISMSLLPTLIKAPSSHVPSGTPAATAGGGSRGTNPPTGPGYKSGEGTEYKAPDPGYRTGGPGAYKSGDTSSGYKNGSPPGKKAGGGDAGAAIVVFPKKPSETAIPAECKKVAGCVTKHIAGANPRAPPYHGKCCTELRTAVSCVCKFLMSTNAKQQMAADGVVRGCHFKNPVCIKKPMPATCSPDVKHCVEMHMYSRSSNPTFRSPCCEKFKTSKRCIMAFRNSPDPHLSEAAKGVIAGCRFS